MLREVPFSVPGTTGVQKFLTKMQVKALQNYYNMYNKKYKVKYALNKQKIFERKHNMILQVHFTGFSFKNKGGTRL